LQLNKRDQTNFSGKRPLWVRLVIISVVWIVVALLLGGYLLLLVFRETLERNFDERLNGMLENLIGVSADDIYTSSGVNLNSPMVDARFEQPYSGWYWQISPNGYNPLRSRSLWDIELDVDFKVPVKTAQYREIIGPEGQNLRLIEHDVTIQNSDIVYRFIVAIDTAELDEQSNRFDNILFIALGVLGAGLVAASLLQVFLGLKPLGHIKESLTKVRNGEKDHLPDDFPKEIQPLADEVNALLDHNNEIITRSRTQVGNLAHALKTPLAVLRNEAIMHDDHILSEVVIKQTENMRKYVEHYLKRARVSASTKIISSRTLILPSINNIARALGKLHQDKKITIRSNGIDAKLIFKGEVNDFEEMVGNLMENAAKWAASMVLVNCIRIGDQLKIEVCDDGPGINAEARNSVFDRGERLDENTPGTGLGLSIVRDLSKLYGGNVVLEDNDKKFKDHGLKVILTLPAA
jgi:signal transduction histidine kinase